MAFNKIIILLTLFIGLNLINEQCAANIEKDKKHIEVTLRMVGHQVLLNAGDSNSRILPIKSKANQYTIEFESEFGFDPAEMAYTIVKTMEESEFEYDYILEVEDANSAEIVYSFEIITTEQKDIVPCQSRLLPVSSYKLIFTLVDNQNSELAFYPNIPVTEHKETSKSSYNTYLLALIPTSILLVLVFIWLGKKKSSGKGEIISLGAYRFDKRNDQLLIDDQKIELTAKESDLLNLLFGSVNSTVKKEHILNIVWEDEGEYIGRTLDVFISKLRKKLHYDSNLKIVNIRGVGYKLIVNN